MAERPDLPVGGPTPGRTGASGTAVRGGVAAPTGGSKDVGGPTPGRKEVDSGTAVRGGVAAPTGGEDDDLLAQAIAQIQAALAHARVGEWEQAGVCDSHCRAVVESLIADPNHPDPAGLAEGLTHVRAQYRELLSLAEAERDRLADSMRQSVRAKAGALAYEENR